MPSWSIPAETRRAIFEALPVHGTMSSRGHNWPESPRGAVLWSFFQHLKKDGDSQLAVPVFLYRTSMHLGAL